MVPTYGVLYFPIYGSLSSLICGLISFIRIKKSTAVFPQIPFISCPSLFFSNDSITYMLDSLIYLTQLFLLFLIVFFLFVLQFWDFLTISL